MPSYRITGGRPLRGTVKTSGSKNAVLPLMSAALLWDAPVTLTNVPAIRDVAVMSELLRSLGCQVESKVSGQLVITPPHKLQEAVLPAKLVQKLRGSILLLGPLLTVIGSVSLPQPGGDVIGRRPIHQHLVAFISMGARVHKRGQRHLFSGKLTGSDIYLEEASVTATENLVMAAAIASGTTTLHHVALEQHVVALLDFLKAGGAQIDGVGTPSLRIVGRGGQRFAKPVTFTVPPDEIDAGTFAIAALLTGGRLTIDPYPADSLRPLTEKLQAIGATCLPEQNGRAMTVSGSKKLKAFQLKVGPAPGFPTDLQPQMAVLATQTHGWSTIHDWMYDNRFGYTEELQKFGAHIIGQDIHRIAIGGPTPLLAQHIYSPDIRAGIAFVLAALAADGTSVIDHVNIIERGYAHLKERLEAIGASIERHD